eukprot:SAG11_NODE_17533_length_515_cov_1.968750_1_plen_29_part_10
MLLEMGLALALALGAGPLELAALRGALAG